MSQKLPYSFWKNGMYFYEFRNGPFNNPAPVMDNQERYISLTFF